MAVIYGTTSADNRNGTTGNDTIYGWANGVMPRVCLATTA